MKAKEKASVKVLRVVYEELDDAGKKKALLAPLIDGLAVRLGWFPGSVTSWVKTLVRAGYLDLNADGVVALTAKGLKLLEKERAGE